MGRAIGFGPALSHAFNDVSPAGVLGAQQTVLSLHSILGGYVGGDKPATTAGAQDRRGREALLRYKLALCSHRASMS